MSDRILSPRPGPDEAPVDNALRPKGLNDFIGQERVKDNLRILVAAARGRGEPLDHILLHGPPGLGKTTLSMLMANEMGVNIRVTAGPAIERPGDLAGLLTNLRQGDVLFIDEVHRLGRAVEEILYPAMEDYALDIVMGKGPGAKSIRLKLPRFTVIGATTRLALLSAPLRARFGAVYRLDFYDQASMETIVNRAAGLLKVPIEPGGVTAIARRARGTPRVALRLLKRVRDYAQVRAAGTITPEVAVEALDLLDVDVLGLDDLDRLVLRTVIEKYRGGPVGLETIAASISEESDTIMDVVEPYLLQLGFLERTPRGRVATRRAHEHLGLRWEPSASQPGLFEASAPAREADGGAGSEASGGASGDE
jgi:Holliday junction DNA helicase RuvB